MADTTTTEIPGAFFVASEVATRTLLWGEGDKVWGDTIPAADLGMLLDEMLFECGIQQCSDCGSTEDVVDVNPDWVSEVDLRCRYCR